MKKMTIEKARINITKVIPEEIDEVEYNLNRGFIEGWDARMEFEAEINGNPKNLTSAKMGLRRKSEIDAR